MCECQRGLYPIDFGEFPRNLKGGVRASTYVTHHFVPYHPQVTSWKKSSPLAPPTNLDLASLTKCSNHEIWSVKGFHLWKNPSPSFSLQIKGGKNPSFVIRIVNYRRLCNLKKFPRFESILNQGLEYFSLHVEGKKFSPPTTPNNLDFDRDNYATQYKDLSTDCQGYLKAISSYSNSSQFFRSLSCQR